MWQRRGSCCLLTAALWTFGSTICIGEDDTLDRESAAAQDFQDTEGVRESDRGASNEDDEPEPGTLQWYHERLSNDDSYRGGRGLVTMQGMSGMFQNPTSGTLGQGQLTLQYCVLPIDKPGPESDSHGIMAAYGLTDYLEVGGFGVIVPADDQTLGVGGPFGRFRFLKDEDLLPEMSVGGIFLEGGQESDILARTELVLSASKGFVIDRDGFFRSLRLHGGVRQIWRHDFPETAEGDDMSTVGFFGGELEFPLGFSVVAEVSTRGVTSQPNEQIPFSIGAQWKPVDVIGLSVAAVRAGPVTELSIYIGIGAAVSF